MRRVSYLLPLMMMCCNPSQAAEGARGSHGICTYFFGVCITCEEPLLCSTSERIDPAQNFGSQAARSTLQTGAIGRVEPAPPVTSSPVKKKPKPVSTPEAREFENFKKFLKTDGRQLRVKDASDERALYQNFLRWKAQSKSSPK